MDPDADLYELKAGEMLMDRAPLLASEFCIQTEFVKLRGQTVRGQVHCAHSTTSDSFSPLVRIRLSSPFVRWRPHHRQAALRLQTGI